MEQIEINGKKYTLDTKKAQELGILIENKPPVIGYYMFYRGCKNSSAWFIVEAYSYNHGKVVARNVDGPYSYYLGHECTGWTRFSDGRVWVKVPKEMVKQFDHHMVV